MNSVKCLNDRSPNINVVFEWKLWKLDEIEMNIFFCSFSLQFVSERQTFLGRFIWHGENQYEYKWGSWECPAVFLEEFPLKQTSIV
jgi:hypothetical protein